MKEKVAQEPNIARALDQVKEAVKTASLPPKVVEKLEKAIQDSTRLQQVGQNVQARAQLTNALNQVEQEVQVEEAQPSEVIRQVKEKVVQEPNMARALDQVKEVAKTASLPPRIVVKIRKGHPRHGKIATNGSKRTGESTINPIAKSSRTRLTSGRSEAK